MKSNLLASVVAASMFLAYGQARAEEIGTQDSMGMYVSVFAGAGDPSNLKMHWIADTGASNYDTILKLKTGYILGAAVGAQVNDYVRGEVEFSRTVLPGKTLIKIDGNGRADPYAANGHLAVNFVFANVWMDIKNESGFTPYLGGGLGVGWVDSDLGGHFFAQHFGNSKGDDMAFQLGAGVKLAVSDQLSLDLGYRYRSMANVNFKVIGNLYDRTGADVETHSLQLGLSYQF